MVRDEPAADPASCSQSGGTLRTAAAALATVLPELPPGRLADEVAATVEALDRVGAHLQVHAQQLAEVAAARRRLADRVAAAGLDLSGDRVVEPGGPVPVEVARRRLATAADLQRQADRLTARLGRARAGLTRALAEGTGALGAVRSRVRDDAGSARGH